RGRPSPSAHHEPDTDDTISIAYFHRPSRKRFRTAFAPIRHRLPLTSQAPTRVGAQLSTHCSVRQRGPAEEEACPTSSRLSEHREVAMSAIGELATLRRKKGRATRSPAEKGDGKAAIGFLAPWFVGLVVIVAGPLLASLYLSFTDYDLLSDPNFIGVDNYLQMLHDPRLAESLKVTFTYVFVSVPLQ